jgi:hypothetical protein
VYLTAAELHLFTLLLWIHRINLVQHGL